MKNKTIFIKKMIAEFFFICLHRVSYISLFYSNTTWIFLSFYLQKKLEQSNKDPWQSCDHNSSYQCTTDTLAVKNGPISNWFIDTTRYSALRYDTTTYQLTIFTTKCNEQGKQKEKIVAKHSWCNSNKVMSDAHVT